MLKARETSYVGPVLVQLAEDGEKVNLAKKAEQVSPPFLKRAQEELREDEVRIYQIITETCDSCVGYLAVVPYTQEENSLEIVPRFFEETIACSTFQEVLSQTINLVSEDTKLAYIILKIEESDEDMAKAAEALGFMKEGLFISNQQQGEFLFFSLYKYKLI